MAKVKRRISQSEAFRLAFTPTVGPRRKAHRFGNWRVPALAHVRGWGNPISPPREETETNDKHRAR